MISQTFVRWIPLLVGLTLTVPLHAQPGQSRLKVFFGNLHSHTSYSDGSGTPRQAYEFARDQARLDFLAVTEHNHKAAENNAGDRKDGILIANDPDLYSGSQPESLIRAAQEFTENGRFVAIYGQEFSSISKGNHVNVFEVPSVISAPNGDFAALVSYLTTHNDSNNKSPIVQFNHPKLFRDSSTEYGAEDFGTRAGWVRTMDQHVRLIEILNGPAMARDGPSRAAEVMEEDYLEYLNLGFHLAPTADQDNHYETWGSATDARTAVVTQELSKKSILEGLRSRHVYATEDKNLRIIFRVSGHLMGERVAAPILNSSLAVEVAITDDDEPEAMYELVLLSDVVGGTPAKVIDVIEQTGNTNPDQPLQFADVKYVGGAQYLLLRVTQLGDEVSDRAWTAPVWFEPRSAVLPDPTPAPQTFIASKRSKIYHTSAECLDAKRIALRNRIEGRLAKSGRELHENCPRKRE